MSELAARLKYAGRCGKNLLPSGYTMIGRISPKQATRAMRRNNPKDGMPYRLFGGRIQRRKGLMVSA